MEGAIYELVFYRTFSGVRPVRDWLALLDSRTEAAVSNRFDRVRRGLFGDAKNLGGGVWELRVDVGPGYRVYYGWDGRQIVVLLCGGQKRAQVRDIERARAYWEDHRRRSPL